ncbi:iron-containing alcohol dehydrogenase [Alkalicoccobacillus porphyridii]|uniref:Iron-containing alcohol dehydrogenase n=1 Tax=Alkalicoccobacillus porphyridii TaxID=2597270 RepID=A0A554A3Y8_9BACI|nr:iron-containing alcohol dehydrogenase [Alkalicoccobacillus porphyridii]TSB48395.1 iron-containing alcohol dehydrogenase [Alkalicoccobacillus porphyridii]
MLQNYQFQSADRILAGVDSIKNIAKEAKSISKQASKVLILTQPFIIDLDFFKTIISELQDEGLQVDVNTELEPEPTDANIEGIYHNIKTEGYDVLIGLGGGSVLDGTKLLSVLITNECLLEDILGTDLVEKEGLPTVLVPTTSGTGSEVTPNAIVTFPAKELKIGIVSKHLLPKLVILDPVLTVSLPKPITAATGMDAFTHSLESFISNKANYISDTFALESIRLISQSIVTAYDEGDNLEAREKMLIGATYGGMALTAAGTAAVHALAYPLGGKFHVTHGVANSMLLPHVMEYNMNSIVDRLAEVAGPMGINTANLSNEEAATKVVEKIKEWTARLNIPQNLSEFGVTEDDLQSLAEAAFNVKRLMDNNPKPVPVEDIKSIYKKLLS